MSGKFTIITKFYRNFVFNANSVDPSQMPCFDAMIWDSTVCQLPFGGLQTKMG